ncbi:hypothetical protein HX037_06590 [Ignatzschineria indica]|uniref:hypothetical protein n=1 Tax=Ignatzschineria indica TaxID=472583 RepID=UPI002577A9A0|nr:hypothetical protein [Ignatzschineria indica]MDM1545551.1 hypothetical protein [Ignatzschineria indica]
MNKKIDIYEILKGHVKTLSDSKNNILKRDIAFFYIFPLALGAASTLLPTPSDGTISLFVNFGSILTALLLSVLVLIYDRQNRLNKSTDESFSQAKNILINELFFNISYSIVASLSLVASCFLYSILTFHYLQAFLFFPLIVAFSVNLFLTILMIVKRLHELLTNNT